MPLPAPESDEEHETFIDRCMSEIAPEFPNAAQRRAVCESQWRRKGEEDLKSALEDAFPRKSRV